MILSITSSAIANSRPSSIGDNTLTIAYGGTLVFSIANFTTETTPIYIDPEGDPLSYIQVQSLPTSGSLNFNGAGMSVGDLIFSGDISVGNFTFVPDVLSEASHSVSFMFDIGDSGSNSISGLKGTMNITIEAKVNSAPSAVGDKFLLQPISLLKLVQLIVIQRVIIHIN